MDTPGAMDFLICLGMHFRITFIDSTGDKGVQVVFSIRNDFRRAAKQPL